MASRATFECVEQLICAWFPDPEPDNAYVRAFRAIASLLLSAAILGTVEVGKLRRFTGYHPAFIASVAWNMRNNGVWTAKGYDPSHWLSSAGDFDERMFFEDFDIATGSAWCPDAEFHRDAINTWDVFLDLEPGSRCRGTAEGLSNQP